MTSWHLSVFHILPAEASPPTVVVRSAGRRVARPRRGEVVLLALHQRGSGLLPSKAARDVLERAAERYFREEGSTTRAMRAVAEALNAYFLARNRNLAAQGDHTVALLAIAVWRGAHLYWGLCGPWRAFRVGAADEVYDAQLAGRGLGIGQGLRMHFARWEATPEGLALLTLEDLPLREQVLADPGRRAEIFLSRLLAVTPPTFTGLVVQMHPGAGEHRQIRVRPGARKDAPPPEPASPPQAPSLAGSPGPAPTPEAATPPLETPAPEPSSPEVSAAPPESAAPAVEALPAPKPAVEDAPPPASEAAPPAGKRPATRRVVRQPPAHLRQQPETPSFEADRARATRSPSPRRRVPLAALARRAVAGLLRLGGRLAQVGTVAGGAVGTLVRRLLPAEEWFTLPRSVMAFTALIVPVLVVAVSLVVYLRRGRAQQFAQYLSQAQAYALQAQALEDPVARHNAFTQSLYYLALAEMYGASPEAEALHRQVQGALDGMDGVVRLAFRPLIHGEVLREVEVKRLAVRRGELYALAREQGKVLRFQLQAGGVYDFDPDFQCAAETFATFSVGPLVDFVLLPDPTAPYAVVAVDEQGNLLFCAPGQRPEGRSATLNAPLQPQGRVLHYEGGRLYLLHGAERALYVFTGERFEAPPYNFFTAGPPADLDQVVDFAVQRGDIYLLYGDGQLMRCLQPSPESAPACEGLTYRDGRPGRADGPTVPEARFAQVTLGGPPDPSLFLLDRAQNGVYRFSLQLRFVEQYRPQEPFDAPVTAMTLVADAASGQQVLYLATGDQVYGAVVP